MTAERAHGLSPIDELIGLEQRLAKTLDLAARATPPATNSAAAALLDSLRQTCQRHRAALEAQRQRVWADAVSAPALSIARSLGQLYAALNQTALAYAVLHTRAHRAFDSQAEGNTASLAESHLRAYTEGVLRGIEEWERKDAASLQEAARSVPIAGAPTSVRLPSTPSNLIYASMS